MKPKMHCVVGVSPTHLSLTMYMNLVELKATTLVFVLRQRKLCVLALRHCDVAATLPH